MLSKKQETTTLYNKLTEVIGLSYSCTCDRQTPICACTGTCYCSIIKRLTVNAISDIILKDDVAASITLVQDLTYSGATMLDCADFIHRVREKEDTLRGILNDSETARPNH